MRAVILADIHANLEAFTSVLEDVKKKGEVDEFWCLGDIVGYGPDPHSCIELLHQQNHICVAGNHDWAATGKVPVSDFNDEAATACRWTEQQLMPEDIEYLNNLPSTMERGDFTLVHGSPREPVWEYILSAEIAEENLSYFKTKYCLVGHSHVPFVFRSDKLGSHTISNFPVESPMLLQENRLIINPGGAGQPRDGDPRASYAIYDSNDGLVIHYRVPYDIGTTQAKMKEYGLPSRLIFRLYHGH
jgi:diadenosine tetraphosphatase ApaH/serine/threonine PP2A family protein phosphatase